MPPVRYGSHRTSKHANMGVAHVTSHGGYTITSHGWVDQMEGNVCHITWWVKIAPNGQVYQKGVAHVTSNDGWASIPKGG